MSLREPQTWPLLKGDFEPRRTDGTDLRNDHGGDQMKQAQNIVLRYLETLPAQGTVNLDTMAEDISRHYPFHGEGVEFFRKAVDALKQAGWVKSEGDELELNKIARVTHRYLTACMRRSR
jgi:hypothetical protein